MDVIVQRGAAGSAEVKHALVIVGGGAAGITVAAELKRHDPGLDIAIVEPSELHWYQPGWTLVGAGVFSRQQTERREEKLIPKGVTWIRAAAASRMWSGSPTAGRSATTSLSPAPASRSPGTPSRA